LGCNNRDCPFLVQPTSGEEEPRCGLGFTSNERLTCFEQIGLLRSVLKATERLGIKRVGIARFEYAAIQNLESDALKTLSELTGRDIRFYRRRRFAYGYGPGPKQRRLREKERAAFRRLFELGCPYWLLRRLFRTGRGVVPNLRRDLGLPPRPFGAPKRERRIFWRAVEAILLADGKARDLPLEVLLEAEDMARRIWAVLGDIRPRREAGALHQRFDEKIFYRKL